MRSAPLVAMILALVGRQALADGIFVLQPTPIADE